jgi:hypothetical protein
VRHLIIRIGKRAQIVFDYGIFNNNNYLRLAVFNVILITVDINLTYLLITEFKDFETRINQLVQIWKKQNAVYDYQFFSRIDIRVERNAGNLFIISIEKIEGFNF